MGRRRAGTWTGGHPRESRSRTARKAWTAWWRRAATRCSPWREPPRRDDAGARLRAEAARLEEEKRLKAETDAAAAKKSPRRTRRRRRSEARGSDVAATAAARDDGGEGRTRRWVGCRAESPLRRAARARLRRPPWARVGKEKSGEGDGATAKTRGRTIRRRGRRAARWPRLRLRGKAIADVAAASDGNRRAAARGQNRG